jgi:hypothetical protein
MASFANLCGRLNGYETRYLTAEQSGSAGVSSQNGGYTSQSASTCRLKMANVGNFSRTGTREPSRDGKRDFKPISWRLRTTPYAVGIVGMCFHVSLFRCPLLFAPASVVGSEPRSGSCFASWPVTGRWQSTIASSCLAAAHICIRGRDALSRRSSDVA